MQSYRFSNQSNINIIYNISIITITNTMSIINILANFGKYAISDCPFICLLGCQTDCLTPRRSNGALFTTHSCHFLNSCTCMTSLETGSANRPVARYRIILLINALPCVSLIPKTHWYSLLLPLLLTNFDVTFMLISYSYNTNVGVQKIPDFAVWKPMVAKRNNTNPWLPLTPNF